MPSSGLFFAYDSSSRLRAETVRTAIDILNERSVPSVGWESLDIEGNILISTICKSIDSSSAVVAEISSMNSNVLFEAGYALGRNKELWLALDTTDSEASKLWRDVGLFETVGRLNYEANSDDIVNSVIRKRPDLKTPELFTELITNAKQREANTLFAPALPIKSQANKSLTRILERNRDIKLLGASEDLGLAPLAYYAREIYRSSAGLFHLLPENKVRSREFNARASFLAGYTHALDLPLLMVAEEGFNPPLDYKDLLYQYPTVSALTTRVENWIDNLPSAQPGRARPGRLHLSIEAPIHSFGQYVAEYESEDLPEYFIETNEFHAIIEGRSPLFVGRKGTGKSATMSQAVRRLSKDRRNLVVPIKPSSYDLGSVLEVVKQLNLESSTDYLFNSIWEYLLYTEIAIAAVRAGELRPAGVGVNTPLFNLSALLEDIGVGIDETFAERLEAIAEPLRGKDFTRDTEKSVISKTIKVAMTERLRRSIMESLKDFDRVAVLIDNLDKTWEPSADFATTSQFLLSLLTTSGNVQKYVRKNSTNGSQLFTIGVFLRTDIFDVMSRHAREPDKVGRLSVHWEDEELLARVIEERYGAKKSQTKNAAFDGQEVWSELFADEVKGIPTRDYIISRTLPRPRDLIYLANAALTTAINRKHEKVREEDIIYAEKQYSRFALDALIVESQAEGFDLEEVLFEFAGLDATLDEDELSLVLESVGEADEIRGWLIRTSFLGLQIAEGDFVHVEGEDASRRKLKAAQRLSQRTGRPLRYRIHPAFRDSLEVIDNDLHSLEVRDVTLTSSSST